MALSSYSYVLHHSLIPIILLLLTSLTTSTLLNPSNEPTPRCLRLETAPKKPTAQDCVAAIAALPRSFENLDYRRDPVSGRIVYYTHLTTIGDLSSPLHLPQSTQVGNCRIDVSMNRQARFASLLWEDVRQTATALMRQCVGDERIVPPTPGPGAGGLVYLGSVLITVTDVTIGSSGLTPNFRIGAYYPPATVA